MPPIGQMLNQFFPQLNFGAGLPQQGGGARARDPFAAAPSVQTKTQFAGGDSLQKFKQALGGEIQTNLTCPPLLAEGKGTLFQGLA